jgi:hypothetical protein
VDEPDSGLNRSRWRLIGGALKLLAPAGLGVGLAFGLRTANSYWLSAGLLWALWVLVVIVTVRLVRHLDDRPKLREAIIRLALALLTTCLLLLSLEMVFRLFVARSDNLGFTFASQNWLKRYWKPINSLGYRDYEWTEEDLAGKTRILVVGDSVAAGFGIKDIDDRFGGVLDDELGDDYTVMHAARSGWATYQELVGMQEYPHRPDIVVLAYYINDILSAAAGHGAAWPSEMNAAYQAPLLVHKSYLANFVYYQVVRLPALREEDPYFLTLREFYADPVIWETHAGELAAVCEWTRESDIELIVVVFPQLLAPEETAFATQKVVALFEEKGVPVLDLTYTYIGADPGTLTANRVDAHPSRMVHHDVGVALAGLIRDLP